MGKYHKDEIEKHEITKEELEFLKKLQKEMNTQDHVSQADPKFWIVQGTIREYGMDSSYGCDGYELIHDTDCVAESVDCVAESIEEAIKYLKENYKEEFKSKNIVIRKNGTYYEFSVDRGDYVEAVYDLEDIVSFLESNGFDYFSVAYYRNVDKNFENTMFLTNKECKAHIKSNYYHYPKDAHSYAMTAWRSYEVKMLWDILQKVNWKLLNGKEVMK